MNDITELPRHKLRAMIEATKATLGELEAEMDRREAADQAAEIDRLEEHMAKSELSLDAIRAFFDELLAELRGKR